MSYKKMQKIMDILCKYLTERAGFKRFHIEAFAYRIIGRPYGFIKSHFDMPEKEARKIVRAARRIVPRRTIVKVRSIAYS